MDDDTLLSKIQKNAFLAEGTKKTYMFSLNMLMQHIPKTKELTLHDVLMNPSVYGKTVTSFENLNTQKTVITAILALLKYSQIKSKHKSIFSQWYEVFKPIMRELKKRERNHVATERQESAILPWEDIVKLRDKTLEKGSMEHLLLSMYTMIPPRRQLDYYKVRLYTSAKDTPDRRSSFIHLHHPKGSYMLITRFKTDKFYKPFYIKLPLELEAAIDASLAGLPRNYLFVGADNEPFHAPNTFTKFSNAILKRVFNNPNMTVNILRHASATYINQKPNVTYGERERHAYQMGHSINKQISYEIKTQVEPRTQDLQVTEDCYKKNASTGKLMKIPCITLNSPSNVKAINSNSKRKLMAAAKLLQKEIKLARGES